MRRSWIAPAALLCLAFLLRLVGQFWDAGTEITPHPDERRVVMTAVELDGWFDDPGFYAYGALHFQAVRAAAAGMGFDRDWPGLVRGGRTLSLGCSLAALMLGWWMARRAWGRRTALMFLLLAAFVPLDLQLSHYATVEAHHAFWVVASLAAIFRFGRRPDPAGAALAGAAVGASLAVKVSSLGLVFPLAVVLLLGLTRLEAPVRLSLGAFGLAGACAAFWLGQPWAFAMARPPVPPLAACALAVVLARLGARAVGRWRTTGTALAAGALGTAAWWIGGRFLVGLGEGWLPGAAYPPFLRGVGEQIAMVGGAADLPYVRVYYGTLPFLYSLREMALWAVGPALVAATLWAVASAVRALWRRHFGLAAPLGESRLLLLVLLAWMVPTALRLATLEVKFVRYWAPLAVPAVLLTAWFVCRLRGRVGSRVRRAVVALAILWGVAYVGAFVQPHPFATASDWLRRVVDRDAVVAWEHWDEHLSGIGGESLLLESYNLPDDDAKVDAWCGRLAQADWLVLTSNRIRRTVFTNDHRYPRTAELYRLLLAGEAGFEVVATADRGPGLFGLRPPVQLADESFVNYDFPRVVILRRTAEVDVAGLAEKSRRHPEAGAPSGYAALEREYVDAAPSLPVVPGGVRQAFDVLVWLVLFGLIGASSWVLLMPLVGKWPDGGLGLALPTGWIGVGWALWVGSKCGLIEVGPASAGLAVAALAAAAAVLVAKDPARFRRVVADSRVGMTRVAGVFTVVFFIFLLARLFNPAIYWGEKPMDFTFFNAFVNAPAWPPGEPWMAGQPLHYYYFADVLAAVPTLVAGIGPGVAYNLVCATVPALAAAALAAVGLVLALPGRRRWFFVLPLAVGLCGNLAWPWLLSFAREGRWFDLWWASSRVVPGYAIDEFPLWTALFADLHAHFVALPVMICALAWAGVAVATDSRRWIGAALLCGGTTAVLAATNPWDVPVLALALGLAVLVAARSPLRGLMRLGAAAAVSLAAASPFLVELAAWLGGSEGIGGRPMLFLNRADFAPWWAVVRHFGLFLLPLGAAVWIRPVRQKAIIAGAAVIGLVAGLGIGSSAAALALASAALFLGAASFEDDRWERVAWVLAGSAMVVVAGAERFVVLDRMNTIFKLYNGAWVLAAAALAVLLLRSRGRSLGLLLVVVLPLAPISLFNLPLGVAQGWLQPRMVSPRPSLDGQAFLARSHPQDAFLVQVLNGASRPGDVVAEAAGPSYGDHVRISMHTGLATVVGWEWHLLQRGQSPIEYKSRVRDLDLLYAGEDATARRAVIDRYGIDWIVVGDLERETYGLWGEDVFCDVPGVLEWARSGGGVLYRAAAPPRN